MTTTQPRTASPLDAGRYGAHPHSTYPYGAAASPVRLTGRITADGSSGLRAEVDRYHLYAGLFCPRSHGATIVRALLGLDDVVTVSYVDRFRDARGWAFRGANGPDLVNGFTLLSEAYTAGADSYAGAVSVPAVWDRHSRAVVSNDPLLIDVDLATAFAAFAVPDAPSLYPSDSAGAIDAVSAEITMLDRTISRAVYADAARTELRGRFQDFEARLASTPYLLGNRLTLADVRLWTIAVRFDVGPNAHGRAGPPLPSYPALWRWARRLYALEAFAATTDFDAFRAPLAALPDWSSDRQ